MALAGRGAGEFGGIVEARLGIPLPCFGIEE